MGRAAEEDATKYTGLCMNCDQRRTCVQPRPAGGVTSPTSLGSGAEQSCTEIDCPDSQSAMRSLRQAREKGLVPFQEIALYGAQIHAVVPDAETFKERVWALLVGCGVDVRAIEWIAPTLEDVFISSVRERGE